VTGIGRRACSEIGASAKAADRALRAARPEPLRVSAFGDDPSREMGSCRSPGALGPGSRLRRRYADPPASALL